MLYVFENERKGVNFPSESKRELRVCFVEVIVNDFRGGVKMSTICEKNRYIFQGWRQSNFLKSRSRDTSRREDSPGLNEGEDSCPRPSLPS